MSLSTLMEALKGPMMLLREDGLLPITNNDPRARKTKCPAPQPDQTSASSSGDQPLDNRQSWRNRPTHRWSVSPRGFPLGGLAPLIDS